MMMIAFKERGRFFNPCRASPMDITTQESYQGCQEIFMDKQPVVMIITGYCMKSNLFSVRGTRNHKLITVLFHRQEWERYCCFTNMIFDQKQMEAGMFQSEISFTTLPDRISGPLTFYSANISPLSGHQAKTNDTPVEQARGTLYFTDIGI
jgi:hypothetical protein